MLKTLGSTKFTTRLGKGGVGIVDDGAGNGNSDSGDDGGHNDEYSPRGLGQAYQRTHQSVQQVL